MKTVLVLDTVIDGRDSTAEILRTFGYRVIAAQTGAEALAVLGGDAVIDLVISEYHIPDMDGIAFVSSVKTFFPGLPVILVTSCCSIETYIRTLSMGVFEYMNKPVPVNELRKVVLAATTGRGLDDAANF